MESNKFSWLAVAVVFEIAIGCFAVDIMHLQDAQQDASNSMEKRSLKSGVCYLIMNVVIKSLL